MKNLNLNRISTINKQEEYKIVKDNSKNYAMVSWAFDEWIVTIKKHWNNRWMEKTFSRKTKDGIVNLIRKEFKTGNIFVSN